MSKITVKCAVSEIFCTMEVKEEFSKLATKFLFLNYNDGKNENSRSELNIILNELNSLDYQKQKFIDANTAARLFDSFMYIPSNADTLIVKTCFLIGTLISKQKIQLPPTSFKKTIDWLLKCLNFSFNSTACDVLGAMQALFKNHPQYCREFWDTLISPNGLLLSLLSKPENKTEDGNANKSEEIIVSTIFCIEALLSFKDDLDVDEKVEEYFATIGSKILDLLYTKKIKIENSLINVLFLTSAINILHKIASENREWTETYLGDLIGISKAYYHVGLPGIPQAEPMKVHISQQSILEPISTPISKGGKIAKTRKPRTVNKNKRNDKNKAGKSEEAICLEGHGANFRLEFDNPVLSPFVRTSDSDFSETETGKLQNERHKQSKLRLSSISLIGIIAKKTEKRILYGYWHAIFPSEPIVHSSSALLNCILRDPNPRCRIAALQTASMLLFGSKGYLFQAENSDKAPSAFMPFSISLGNMIISMYDALTHALSTENSLPVLTQVLKCLTVLIQATPFHRLKPGIVTNFVKYMRRMVYHRDPTIQVAALMVMEFLISVQEITKEISDCVGIPKSNMKSARKNQNQLNDSSVNEIIEPEMYEEIIDSDFEEDVIGTKEENNQNTNSSISTMSWLLDRVLYNLGVFNRDAKKTAVVSTPVRIECLQVLSSMAPHFLLLKDHLNLVAIALNLSLNDAQPEVRLYTGKCLDALGHSINTYLLENAPHLNEDLNVCQQFWTIILPSVIQKVQDQSQSPAFKAVLCDFMSNIGVHIFERLPRSSHIQLIALLSGISYNEDTSVRAAAVRALAVYVLFPSLREDLCYVENTAESIIKLMKDSNLYVRVKASWSMGNVSDALISNCVDSHLDRISDDLLKRLLIVAVESAGDNDKVRSNSVRSLGNLLRLIRSGQLESSEWRLLCMQAIEKLVNCMNTGGNAKVKWNSCYAVGNFMRNPHLFSNYKDLNWQAIVFPSLCNLIINSTNFKVRINGAAALSVINERKNYGSYLSSIWTSLLAALEQSDNLVDFNEYKHRDNLQEQICLSLSHIIKVSTPEDWSGFKNELVLKLEVVKQNWIRVINRVLPENAAPLLQCSIELQEILQKTDISIEQRNSINVLSSCFIRPSQDFF